MAISNDRRQLAMRGYDTWLQQGCDAGLHHNYRLDDCPSCDEDLHDAGFACEHNCICGCHNEGMK